MKTLKFAVGAGTSAMYVGLGFVPSKVRLMHAKDAGGSEAAMHLDWNRALARHSVYAEGVLTIANGTRSGLTEAAGVARYFGGDLITTAAAHYVVPIEHPALEKTYAVDMRSSSGGTGTITTWTLQTAGNETGKFNYGVDTSYVGVGSEVVVIPDSGGMARVYSIVALANDGNADDEVTLNGPCPSGRVQRISYKYDFANLPAGYRMPAGIVINDTTYFNVASDLFCIEAE